jgi:hypothetical protein
MAVAPFLPRSGTPYIPRPALDIIAQNASGNTVDILVGGITTDLADGKVTLRVFNPMGARVHDLQEDVLEDEDEVTFAGVTVDTPGPHRVVAVTSLGQVGREIVVTAAPAAPTNSAVPTITGTPTVGQTLTSANGAWTGSPTFTRQWLADDVEIAGATNTTLVLGAEQEGAVIKVRVTGTNAGGSASATSAGTSAVAPA